jgi:hypothetical protein
MKTAGPLQKLLHLANAREALRSGDLVQALNEVDAAVAADPTFAAAQTLRAEVVTRMNATVVSDRVTEVPPAAPTAVATVVAEPLIPASIAVTTTTSSPVAPSIAAPQIPRHRRSSSMLTAIPMVLGVLVIAIGVGVVLLASGIVSREREPARPVAIVTAHPKPVPPSDIALPTPPRAAVVVARVAPSPAVPTGEAPAAAAIEWASPRLTHLSVRPRWRASALHVEDAALLKDLGQGVGELWVGKLTGNEDAIFVGGSIDDGDWAKLRASIKPTGVVWRIYSNRSSPSADAPIGAATAAGFSRVKKVRYSADFSAEQFTLRRGPR